MDAQTCMVVQTLESIPKIGCGNQKVKGTVIPLQACLVAFGVLVG
jgi:hypothetical protein